MTRARLVALALAATLFPTATAQAEPAVGLLTGTNVLVGFDTSAPGTLLHVAPITGLGAGERVLAVDFRHHPFDPTVAPGLLGLSVARSGPDQDALRLYTIDPDTGAATVIGAAPVLLTTPIGAAYAIDITPAVDRVRVVNSLGFNLRINPFSGALSGMDSSITPPGSGVGGLAYDRVQLSPGQGATTLFAVAGATSQLGRIGGVDGVPTPNGGAFTAIGPLGVALDAGATHELDIAPGGAAYMSARVGGVDGIYAVDLATGAATALGQAASPLTGLAILPAATISFDAGTAAVAESAGAATLTLTRSGDTAPAVSVAWAASNGASGTVRFDVGQTRAAISVPVAADALDEPDETVAVTLSRPSFHAAVGVGAAALTIVDDDPSPDRTAPGLAIGGVPKGITYRRLLARGIAVRTTPGEPAAIEATLLGTARKARLSRFNLALVTRRLPLASGTRTVTLKPKRRALRRPRRTVKLRVRVVATDAAGNRTTANRTVRLRPR